MMTRLDEIRALLAEVKRGGVFPSCERADTDMRLLVAEVERTQAALAAERIEVAHLREAFVTMERAANQHETDLAAARAVLETARDLPEDGPAPQWLIQVDRAAWLAWQARQT